ncbi:hypothetical protein SADUNF_Sadunf14G0088600 [Salix dunnii]|uniref:Uncharacterized protein n=1 Tax=Salix dunnii TaxID=1413687 RepID=A0A835JFG5_9ROSI|nr:hypothetical protein SADUNF_Sadunf14G0088600 [Salix dunnii]
MSCTTVTDYDDLLKLELMHNWPINEQLTGEDVKSCLLKGLKSTSCQDCRWNKVKTLRGTQEKLPWRCMMLREALGGYKLEDWDQVTLIGDQYHGGKLSDEQTLIYTGLTSV